MININESYNSIMDDVRCSDFPLNNEVYVDHAGCTLYSQSQIDAVHDDLSTHLYGNPHSNGTASQLTMELVEQQRSRILAFFNTSCEEYSVIFTSGCTGALKLLAESFDFQSDIVHKSNDEPVIIYSRDAITPGHHLDNKEIFESTNLDHEYNTSFDRNRKLGEHNTTGFPEKRSGYRQRGCFCYLQDNHTSVYGMRGVVEERGVRVICLNEEDLISPSREKVTVNGNCLFAFPVQSNYSGRKYPLKWVKQVAGGLMDGVVEGENSWYTLLDAASFVSTSHLDLDLYRPDFVALSFYKIFGYPTGLGALLVKNSAALVLRKSYFGGGTIAVSSAMENFQVFRSGLSERMEDGTLPFLNILALRHGFDAIERLAGGMQAISRHTFYIAHFFYNELKSLKHGNGATVAVVYTDTEFTDVAAQGAIVNFNLKRSDGHFVGYSEVDKMASLFNVHLRTGCFCNIGACQKFLGLTTAQLISNYNAGHECGDDIDLIDGHPTGSVRVSFGYMSTLDDATMCLNFITSCFVQDSDLLQDIVWSQEYTPPTPQGDTCSLTDICLYPVKSCAVYSVPQWTVGSTGLLYDRHWMIVNGAGVRLTLNMCPQMCFIQPQVDLDNLMLCLYYRGSSTLVLPIEVGHQNVNAKLCSARVCGKSMSLVDCGHKAAEWLSRVLNLPNLRLVHQKSGDPRRSKNTTLSLVNLSQFLVVGRSSVAALQSRISQAERCNISEDKFLLRFRGNLIFRGREAFAEEKWNEVEIGPLILKMQGKCNRCNMICVNTEDGSVSKEPLKTLASWPERKMKFGVYMSHSLREGDMRHIRVGMPVTTIKPLPV